MKKILIAILLISSLSCAVIEAPNGGPRDVEAPEILEVSPPNFKKNLLPEKIEITFSEYIQRNEVIKSIRINPPINFEHSWSGKKLKIKFKDDFLENTTYSINLGTAYNDLNGNPPASAFEYIFSTGDKLDSLQISGKLLSDSKTDGLLVYLWRINDFDTLNLITTQPQYLTTLGSNGEYRFRALKEGIYRSLIFEDRNQNKIYDLGFEKYSIASEDHQAVIEPKQLLSKLSQANDISGPSLLTAYAPSNVEIDMSFSEPILLDNSKFSLRDSVNETNEIKVRSSYYLDSIPGKKIRIITSNLEKAETIKLKVDTKDTLLKSIIDSTKFKYFPPGKVKQFGIPSLEMKLFSDSSENISKKDLINIKLSTPLRGNLKDKIKLFNNEGLVPIDVQRIDGLNYSINLESLDSEKWYKFEFDFSNLVSIFNEKFEDSLRVVNFKTEQNVLNSSVSGILDTDFFCDNIVLQIYNKDYVYNTEVIEGNWVIKDVIPGTYQTKIFCDKNGDGKYNYGKVEPFEFSESFKSLKAEIEVKERWDLEDIILK